MDDSQISLPKAPILSYLSNVSTPTRARLIAARYVFWIGVLFFVLSMALFCWVGLEIWHYSSYMRFVRGARGVPVPVDIWTRIKFALSYRYEYVVYFFLILGFLFAPGLVLVGFAAPIRRGRRVPSIVALIVLTPAILSIMLATATYMGAIFIDILGDHGRYHWGNAPWLVLTPIPVLVVLLLKDLCAFLFWIARQPQMEKPPQPFLPPSITRSDKQAG